MPCRKRARVFVDAPDSLKRVDSEPACVPPYVSQPKHNVLEMLVKEYYPIPGCYP